MIRFFALPDPEYNREHSIEGIEKLLESTAKGEIANCVLRMGMLLTGRLRF